MKVWRMLVGVLLVTMATQWIAVSASPSTDPCWTRAVNLLPFIEPAKDAISGEWKIEKGTLICNGGFARIGIPYSVPKEYDIRIKFTPLEGKLEVRQILTRSDRQFLWGINTDSTKVFGFGTIQGKNFDKNPTTKENSGMENGKTYEYIVQVRKDGLRAYLNDKQVSEWKTDYLDMDMPGNWKLNNPTLLGLGANNSRIQFHSIDLYELSDKGHPLPRSEQVATKRGSERTRDRGKSESRAEATLPAGDAAWSKAVNLLKLIDPKQNTVWGKWHMEQGELQCDNEGSARLEIPYSLPDEYDFRIKFTPLSGRQEIRQIMAKSGHQFLWSIGADGKTTYGFGLINGKKANENRTTIKNGPSLETGVAYESIVQVRKDGLKVYFNGKLLTQWKTDYQDMSMVSGWGLNNDAWLGLGAYQGCVRFHRLDLLEVTGRGQAVAQPLAPAATGKRDTERTPSKTRREPTPELADAALQKEARKFARNQSSIQGLCIHQMSTGQRLGGTQDIIATLERTHSDQETVADFTGEVSKDTSISLEEAVRLLKVRYPVWQAGNRIRLSYGDKYTKQEGGSAGGAFAVLLLSLLEGVQIDPDFAMTGDVTVDGKIRKVGAVTEKIRGALLEKCKVVAIPAANKDNLSDLVVLNGPSILWQAQLFAVENLDQAAAVARQDRAEHLAKAMAQFAELQKSFGPQSTVTALRAPNMVKALQEVLKLAPNHLSAEYMLLAANGKVPTLLSLSSSLEETWWAAAPLLPTLFADESSSRQKSDRMVVGHVPDELFQTMNARLTWLVSRLHPKAHDLHAAMKEYVASYSALNRSGMVASVFARQQCLAKRDKLLGEALKLGADRKVLEELMH